MLLKVGKKQKQIEYTVSDCNFAAVWLTINNALGSFQENLIVDPVRWNKLAALSPGETKVYQRVERINTAAFKPALRFIACHSAEHKSGT